MTLAWTLSPFGLAVIAIIGFSLVVAGAIRDGRRRRLAWIRRAGMVALVVILGLTPAIPRPGEQQLLDLNVIIVLDRTTSMTADDGADGKTRLDMARADMETIASSLSGARFQVVSAGARPSVDMPATSDAAALIAYAQSVTPETASAASGSSLGASYSVVSSAVTKAVGESGHVALFILSDGEMTATEKPSDASAWAGLSSLVDAGATVTYGTTQGGQMHAYQGGGRYSSDPVIDPDTHKPAISVADPDAMASIASHAGIAAVSQGDLEDVLADVPRAPGGLTSLERTYTRDVIWPFVWLLIGLEAWEIYDQAARVRVRRETHRMLKGATR